LEHASNWQNNDAPALGESPLHLVFPTSATRLFLRPTTSAGSWLTLSRSTERRTRSAGIGAGTNLTVNSSVGHSWWNIRANSGTGHTFHYSLNLLLDGTLEFNITTNANVVMRSRMSAATANSGLSKDGPGSVYLDEVEDNTFDGTTTVIDGLLRLEGSHVVLGGFTVTDVTVPGPLIIGGTSPSVHPNVLVWQAEQIADTSAVTVNQNGELNLADVNETIGSLIVVGGYVDSGNAILKLNGNVTRQRFFERESRRCPWASRPRHHWPVLHGRGERVA
jgi:autotransporter-associated beta strand protein